MNITNDNLTDQELKTLLATTDAPTIVRELDHASAEERARVFRKLATAKAEHVFSYLDPGHQAEIIQDIEHKKATDILENMEPDDRARLFDELPEEVAERFLRRLSLKERRATSLLLKYPNETAGRIMSPFFIPLQPEMTVEEALKAVRAQGQEAETIYVLPVVDEKNQLNGVIELNKLVLANSNQTIRDLMHKEVKSFSVQEDQEKVARYIQSTDCLAVPIVEENKYLVGIVTMDDAMDIMQQEETEDIFRGIASGSLGKPYLSVPITGLLQIRVIWLILLAVGGTLTVNVLSSFEGVLEQAVVLSLFIPLLIGIGGNTGSQSATTIVRALAVDDVRVSDFLTVAARETSVGILLGLSLGVIAYVVVSLIYQYDVALIVSLSLLTICTMAALTGSLMPLLARVLHLDPAVVSAPFVSTVIDATGLLVYFFIAKIILNL